MAAAEFTVKARSLITVFMGPCLGLGREIFERRSQKGKKKKGKENFQCPRGGSGVCPKAFHSSSPLQGSRQVPSARLVGTFRLETV